MNGKILYIPRNCFKIFMVIKKCFVHHILYTYIGRAQVKIFFRQKEAMIGKIQEALIQGYPLFAQSLRGAESQLKNR